MPYKITGTTGEDIDLYVINESTELLEKKESHSAGPYESKGLLDSDKLIVARKTGGQSIAYGSIAPNYYAANYFGDGSDGDGVISSSIQLTVPNKNGSYDGDMLVMNYNTLDIESGGTLTTDQPCRGMLIYVNGDCNIDGTLTMTNRGASANPTIAGASDSSTVSATGIRLPMLTSGGSDTLASADFAGCGNSVVNAMVNQSGISSNGTIFTIDREGAAGGQGYIKNQAPIQQLAGQVGFSSANKSGGGGGGHMYGSANQYPHAGDGAAGTCFSGGSGGGGCSSDGGNPVAGHGAAYGGSGGYGAKGSPPTDFCAGGGVGNPGGNQPNSPSCGQSTAPNGTGGLLLLIVKGAITGNGNVYSQGRAAYAYGGYSAGGGGSGGGNILVLYGGATSQTWTLDADGKAASRAARGGHGYIQGPTQVFAE